MFVNGGERPSDAFGGEPGAHGRILDQIGTVIQHDEIVTEGRPEEDKHKGGQKDCEAGKKRKTG